MTTIIEKLQIPDPERPIPSEERKLGPSGELMEFVPKPLDPNSIVGQAVEEICPYVGTYGMGGPGFFGLRFGEQWLVIALWGAAEWMVARGRNVGDSFHDSYGRERPWLADWLPGNESDELSKNVVGQVIKSIDVQARSMEIAFENGFDLTIEEDASKRPLLEGTKEPRAFKKDDDLRKGVFLAPTTEIWI